MPYPDDDWGRRIACRRRPRWDLQTRYRRPGPWARRVRRARRLLAEQTAFLLSWGEALVGWLQGKH